jgi:hypothetical protein
MNFREHPVEYLMRVSALNLRFNSFLGQAISNPPSSVFATLVK